jgi:TetR/AcrR family transcriptional repressor of lmrAB and yxaGH operons
MATKGIHRDAILATAIRLFRRQGYAATGLNEIVADSGAPKGSLYHYFPGGKAEIGQIAVEQAAVRVAKTLRALFDRAPDAGDQLAVWMKASRWQDGCPITTVLLETVPQNAAITAAGHAALTGWADILAERLIGDGADEAAGRRLAGVAISALEGALIQARVQQSADPLIDAAEVMAMVVRSAVAAG